MNPAAGFIFDLGFGAAMPANLGRGLESGCVRGQFGPEERWAEAEGLGRPSDALERHVVCVTLRFCHLTGVIVERRSVVSAETCDLSAKCCPPLVLKRWARTD